MRAFKVLILLAFVPTLAQPAAVLIDNTACLASNDPYPCCTGSGTGTCDGKVAVSQVLKRHSMIEDCQSFWQSFTCADASIDTDGDGIGDQWLVESTTCTQGEADAFAVLPTTTCNAAKQADDECRDEFDNSTIMPTVQGCRKAYTEWTRSFLKTRRNTGRSVWRTTDGTKPDDSDVVAERVPPKPPEDVERIVVSAAQ